MELKVQLIFLIQFDIFFVLYATQCYKLKKNGEQRSGELTETIGAMRG